MVLNKAMQCCWLAVALMLPLSASAEVVIDPAWQLSKKEIKRLEEGRTITHTTSGEGNIKHVDAFLLFKAPAPLIFSLITDYAKLPEFMPHLEKIKVLESNAQGALVNYQLGLPFGVEKKYRLRLAYEKKDSNMRMAWTKVPWQGLKPKETIVATTGYWLFKPVPHSDETLLVYHTTTDPGDVPFGLGWIVDYLTNKSVVELLENTKERAEKQWSIKQKHSS